MEIETGPVRVYQVFFNAHVPGNPLTVLISVRPCWAREVGLNIIDKECGNSFNGHRRQTKSQFVIKFGQFDVDTKVEKSLGYIDVFDFPIQRDFNTDFTNPYSSKGLDLTIIAHAPFVFRQSIRDHFPVDLRLVSHSANPSTEAIEEEIRLGYLSHNQVRLQKYQSQDNHRSKRIEPKFGPPMESEQNDVNSLQGVGSHSKLGCHSQGSRVHVGLGDRLADLHELNRCLPEPIFRQSMKRVPNSMLHHPFASLAETKRVMSRRSDWFSTGHIFGPSIRSPYPTPWDVQNYCSLTGSIEYRTESKSFRSSRQKPRSVFHSNFLHPQGRKTVSNSPETTGVVKNAPYSVVEEVGLQVPYGYDSKDVNRPFFIIEGDLNDVLRGWTNEELRNSRRIIQFWRRQTGCAIQVNFQPAQATNFFPSEVTVSCILWIERMEAYITSFDLVHLIEALADARFDRLDRNRVRRNLEKLGPITIKKGDGGSNSFFKRIMNFADPKPRHIERDIKVFPWGVLNSALLTMMYKIKTAQPL